MHLLAKLYIFNAISGFSMMITFLALDSPTNVNLTAPLFIKTAEGVSIDGEFDEQFPLCIEDSMCNENERCFNETCVCLELYDRDEYGACTYVKRYESTTFVVSWFLGMWGMDFIYLSRGNITYIAAGVFKMITLGGLGVMWWIDTLIVYFVPIKDANEHLLVQDLHVK
jgi:hypothetical protein